jgi:hypothetical protein
MQTLLKSAAKSLFSYAALSAAFFAVNLLVYVVWFVAAEPKYTFLSGNSVVIVVTIVELVGCFWFTCLRRKDAADVNAFRYVVSAMITGTLLLYGLHATVFTIVERSVSVNVMRYLAQTGGSQPYDKIEQNFVDTFVYRDKAVCKRLDEQVHLGNVANENGQYVLTPKGMRTFNMLEIAHKVTADTNPKNAVSCR